MRVSSHTLLVWHKVPLLESTSVDLGHREQALAMGFPFFFSLHLTCTELLRLIRTSLYIDLKRSRQEQTGQSNRPLNQDSTFISINAPKTRPTNQYREGADGCRSKNASSIKERREYKHPLSSFLFLPLPLLLLSTPSARSQFVVIMKQKGRDTLMRKRQDRRPRARRTGRRRCARSWRPHP